ncbi:sterol desaturase family protein [Flavobacterium lacus]|uniref:Sterol desaturase/sphingolipid hydroxylase (Fatty acid hydroxylase superfamily) n=1 Tax=Flavobacterium lacus TaxID=1353778 RepID=A0A328WKD9_9FLAO|nr:sterol desaturase family protein [Flavobacterium lacus]RAR46673.1 sterol desaturase/sphingolipid hydroxylase (fatty acid hydroxylase superfamily) [Flavobacterium lacus]
MQTLIDYFETISSLHRGLILVGGITVFWLIENAFPLFKFQYNKINHAGINIFFTITTIIINFVMAFILLLAADFAIQQNFGILQWLPEMNIWVYTLVGLLLLDFIGAYLVHLIEHKVKFLWRFHLIHHTDTWIDTTSANRHHPGESVIRFVFTVLGVLIVGSPMWMVFLYQSLSVVFSQFNHANIPLPKKLDKVLSYFIISPDMHKVHHHYKLPYTDSNYGNIFSVWDRIFGTYSYLERGQIIYGVDTHMKPEENNDLSKLLKIPFQKSRSPEL